SDQVSVESAAHDERSTAAMAPDFPEPDEPAARPVPATTEPSDEEWLASLPLPAEIRDTRPLDQEAPLWPRLQPEVARIREELGASPQEVADAAYRRPQMDRLRVRLLYGLLIRSPHEWRLCERCGGSCTDQTGKLPCTRCDGRGFFVEHEGNI